MNGFLNASLNQIIAFHTLKYITAGVLRCMECMVQDCCLESRKLANNEVVIRDYLFSHYLDDDFMMERMGLGDFRFESEAPENYIDGVPKGRADLKVYSIDEFRHRKRYFLMECKRVDGNLTLNREYVDHGIRRFASADPKYGSYYSTNCMLGFLVRGVDLGRLIAQINGLLHCDYADIPVQEYLHMDLPPDIYASTHMTAHLTPLTLLHAFADCTELVDS